MDKHRLHDCLPCDQRCCCFSWTCANRSYYLRWTTWLVVLTESEIKNSLTISLWNCVLLNCSYKTRPITQVTQPSVTTPMAGMGNDGRHRVTKWTTVSWTLWTTSVTLRANGSSLDWQIYITSVATVCTWATNTLLSAERCNNNGQRWIRWNELCISCCVSPLDPENEEQRHNINTTVLVLTCLKLFLLVWTVDLRRCSKRLQSIWHQSIRDEVLEFRSVKANFEEKSLDWLTDTYVDALNIIHYATDKYNAKLFKWPSCQLTNALTWDSVSVDLPTLLIR